MALEILKFGGSSIADAEKIRHVANIIRDKKSRGDIVIVISAFGGVTDTLKDLADKAASGKPRDQMYDLLIKRHRECIHDLNSQINNDDQYHLDEYFIQLESDLSSIEKAKQNSSQSQDKILSYGELLSTTILAQYLYQIGIPAEQLDARKVILTDNNFGHAYVHYQKSYDRIKTYYKECTKVQIVTGFLGATENEITTTLGRNGSDYTASIFGAALNAKVIEIWTDVDGILSADPNIIKKAKAIPSMTYEEAMELAHAGAKVIFPPSMIPALYKNIPIFIKNTFDPEQSGTRIGKDRAVLDEIVVGISSLSNISLVLLQGAGLVSLKGTIGRIFSTLAKENINIILISMAFSEHSVCFAIKPKYNTVALRALKTEFETEIKQKKIDRIKLEKSLSLVAVVGEGMRQNPGVSGRVFSTLGSHDISIIAIAQGSSERNISFIVDDADVSNTLRILHNEFFEKKEDFLDIYLVGTGTIGSELLNIICQHNMNNIRICALGNSKKMLLGNAEINPVTAIDNLKKASDPFVLDKFLKHKNFGSNSKVFVDCTASETIAEQYADILNNGFSVVAANKIANTLGYDYYRAMRKSAKERNVHFRYETNVGAGLPIINTLQGLLVAGDEILEIQGILSGTLSYLFNSFDGQTLFSSLVSSAREKGFTEPDPREDLNGMDVARKMLILVRETGAKLDLDDVSVESLIPEALGPDLPVAEFLNQFSNFDSFFLDRLNKAKTEQKVLRYLGTWDGSKVRAGLEAVDQKSPFYHQYGSENLIMFKTRRYHDVPLVIKGYGAGAGVTATGVLQDIQACIKN